MKAAANHAHRVGKGDGLLTFDGDRFRFSSPQMGGHTFRFTIDDLVSANFEADGGSTRSRVNGGEEKFVVHCDWRRLFATLVHVRRR